MPEIPNRLPGEVILASYSNDIRDRAVMRYADRTARDASNPVPEVGDLAYILTLGILEIFDGVAWEVYLTDDDAADIAARLAILENTIVDPFNDTGVSFAGTAEIEAASITIPVTGDYMIHFNGNLIVDPAPDNDRFRYASKLMLRSPLTQLSFWQWRSPAEPFQSEFLAASITMQQEVSGVAGDEYFVRVQATTTSSDEGGVENISMYAQQLPPGVI